ncbi:hypothetical protein Vadar_024177 [Vaccinium darrowii]|uniref:Uncharacterized protein n=1 Tax=Vaccinium darrowii TaxID=229202 RepID=A0ACB7XSW1_9ERIC|nr:hypothetical protein Vadar_024177 [Vaccinium darrowii]
MKRSRAQVQKKRSRKIAPTTIFSIPIYILMEILSKLPIFTICNCSPPLAAPSQPSPSLVRVDGGEPISGEPIADAGSCSDEALMFSLCLPHFGGLTVCLSFPTTLRHIDPAKEFIDYESFCKKFHIQGIRNPMNVREGQGGEREKEEGVAGDGFAGDRVASERKTRGSPTETLLRFLLHLNDKVQWTSRDVADSEPSTSPLFERFIKPFNRDPHSQGKRNFHNEKKQSADSVDPFVVASGKKGDIRIPSKALQKFKPKCDVPTKELDVLSSCNGLIFFHCTCTYDPFVICNPVINEYVILPQIRKAFYDHCGSGFGFFSGTDEYKVLRFLSPSLGRGPKVEAEINTLGTNLWRRVGEGPLYLRGYSGGCFLNGALHWIVHDTKSYF